ncbi:MAG: hypothetical protein WA435_15300 [Gallionellaceae bacterium]
MPVTVAVISAWRSSKNLDGNFHLGGELVDPGGFVVEAGGDGLLFFDRWQGETIESARLLNVTGTCGAQNGQERSDEP